MPFSDAWLTTYARQEILDQIRAHCVSTVAALQPLQQQGRLWLHPREILRGLILLPGSRDPRCPLRGASVGIYLCDLTETDQRLLPDSLCGDLDDPLSRRMPTGSSDGRR